MEALKIHSYLLKSKKSAVLLWFQKKRFPLTRPKPAYITLPVSQALLPNYCCSEVSRGIVFFSEEAYEPQANMKQSHLLDMLGFVNWKVGRAKD